MHDARKTNMRHSAQDSENHVSVTRVHLNAVRRNADVVNVAAMLDVRCPWTSVE